jgi:hypothetical protein
MKMCAVCVAQVMGDRCPSKSAAAAVATGVALSVVSEYGLESLVSGLCKEHKALFDECYEVRAELLS